MEAKRADFVQREFADSLSAFEDDLIYSFLTGTHSYEKCDNGSDLDVVVVLDNDAYSKKEEVYEAINEFLDTYIDVHVSTNRSPDKLYPGEYISIKQVGDALAGRGFGIDDSEVKLRAVEEESFWEDPEKEYRCWRSMLAFNNNRFLGGNQELFETHRDKAWDQIIRFIAKNERALTVEKVSNHIVDGGEPYLGINDKYEPNFSEREREQISSSLSRLSDQGFLEEKKGRYFPVDNNIENWESDIVAKHEDSLWRSEHLIDWDKVRSLV